MKLFVFLHYIKYRDTNPPDKSVWGVSPERWRGMIKWYESRLRDSDLEDAITEDAET